MNIINFFKNEYKFQFQSSYVLWGYLIGILINLMVYYYSSKVFVPVISVDAEYLKLGYFEFIIIGELCLLVSQVSLGEGQEAFFRYKESGIAEQLYFSPSGLVRSFTGVYWSLVLICFVYIGSTIIFSKLFFDSSLTLVQIIRLLSVQFLSGVFFIGLYFLNLTLSAIVGRRNGSIQHGVNILTFFSGAYFPIEIISSQLIKNILNLSPFAMMVKFSRAFIYDGKILYLEFLGLLIWLLVTGFFSIVIYKLVIKKNGVGKYVSP